MFNIEIWCLHGYNNWLQINRDRATAELGQSRNRQVFWLSIQ